MRVRVIVNLRCRKFLIISVCLGRPANQSQANSPQAYRPRQIAPGKLPPANCPRQILGDLPGSDLLGGDMPKHRVLVRFHDNAEPKNYKDRAKIQERES